MRGWWEKRAGLLGMGFGWVLAAVATSPEAAAFCRTKSCALHPDLSDFVEHRPPCIADAHGCDLLGKDLRWPTNCISFSVQRDGSQASAIDFETATAVLEAAFETWTGADCGLGERPSLTLVNRGEASCSRPEYNQNQPNANVLMFREESWPYENASNALALTTVTYNTETGVIYDADIEFNAYGTTFTTDDELPPIAADLASIATHEIGHFLGLSHSSVGDTTMRWRYDYTTSFRTLDPDDVNGICAIYPPGRPLSESCEPHHGFSARCAPPERADEGCTLGAKRSGTSSSLFALASLGVLFGARRGRRRSPQPGA